MPNERRLDTDASSVTIRTRAKGLLGKLAHDLEIQADQMTAAVSVDGDSWQAELTFPVSGLRVIGALKGGQVDASILSRKDISDIESKIRGDVLIGNAVKVVAKGSSRSFADAVVVAPRGEQKLAADLSAEERDGALVVFGKTRLSLDKLGVKEIKGPLGAFRVDDAVEVAFFFQLV